MLNAWTGLALELRLGIVFVAGLLGGVLANWLIYTAAFFPRPISPWNRPSADAPPRSAFDRVPVLGWLGLRREAAIHGRGFWVRPLLIELAVAFGLAGLYYFEVHGGLFPPQYRTARLLGGFNEWIHFTYLAHCLLVILLAAATFIDFDEQTIPDWITFPGTLIGLAFATWSPELFLPGLAFGSANPLQPVLAHSPNPWGSVAGGEVLDGPSGLGIGLAIVAAWAFALLDRRVILRRGFKKAIAYFFAGMFRHWFWKVIAAAWIFVSLWVLAVHQLDGSRLHWHGLITALVGLAVGGGVVWIVRLVAGWAMGLEAMGFGDVILLGMIGTYIGWQASVLTFFLAPVTALAIVLVYYLITGENRIAFGPYLCAAAILVIVGWNRIWNAPDGVAELFIQPKLLLGVFVVAMIAMAFLMRILRLFRES